MFGMEIIKRILAGIYLATIIVTATGFSIGTAGPDAISWPVRLLIGSGLGLLAGGLACLIVFAIVWPVMILLGYELFKE
jgi:hypothetical protein